MADTFILKSKYIEIPANLILFSIIKYVKFKILRTSTISGIPKIKSM